jgi:putative esterase
LSDLAVKDRGPGEGDEDGRRSGFASRRSGEECEGEGLCWSVESIFYPMKSLRRFFLTLVVLSVAGLEAAEPAPMPVAEAVRKPGAYPLGPDSLPQPGVPPGRLEGPFEFHSAILAGTVRRYWIFVPAQYMPEQAAAVLVFQDGQRATNPKGELRVPQVLENLIHKKDIPVTIGIFITPGNTSEHYPDNLGSGNPNHRAPEYDALSDAYTRFLIEEMLPEVGKKYKLTDDPEDRAIGGTSSGAICAFTVAWHRPDRFRKVISMIGSYTSIGYKPAHDGQPAVSGGEIYPTLIRREPIKPIRIFLQDGENDLSNSQPNGLFPDGVTLSNQFGNWHLANMQMLSAFEYANRNADAKKTPGPRYDVNHEWGDGAHSDAHGGAILPAILRWMWRDRAKPAAKAIGDTL